MWWSNSITILELLGTSTFLKFNGMNIFMDNHSNILISMMDHANRLELLSLTAYYSQQFINARANGTYIVAVNCPNLSFKLSKAIHVQTSTNEDLSYINLALLSLKFKPDIMCS